MCDTNAYILDQDGREELLLESVTLIRPENGEVYLKNLFGEEKRFAGRIKEVSLKVNKVFLERQ
jgi:predicted RNA-binding protein